MTRPSHSPEAIERLRSAWVKRWSDPDARARNIELIKLGMARPGVRERISQRTKAALADPAVRARQRAGIQRAMADPEIRRKISERTREAMRDPAVRARMRVSSKTMDVDRELVGLRALWEVLGPEARTQFIREVTTVPVLANTSSGISEPPPVSPDGGKGRTAGSGDSRRGFAQLDGLAGEKSADPAGGLLAGAVTVSAAEGVKSEPPQGAETRSLARRARGSE